MHIVPLFSSVFHFLWGVNVLGLVPVSHRDLAVLDSFPSVCQPCLGPLGSSEAPASCFAMARLSVAHSSIQEPSLTPSPLVPVTGLAH